MNATRTAVIGALLCAATLAGCHKEVSEPDKPMAGTTGPSTSQSTAPQGFDSGGVGKGPDPMASDAANKGGVPAANAPAAPAAPAATAPAPAPTPPATTTQ